MADNTVAELREENAILRLRLKESEDVVRALGAGEVDAITIQTTAGMGVFTLKGAEQPYRQMVETMSEGAVTVESDGLITYCNQRFADILRIDLESIMGTQLTAYFVERDRHSITAALSTGSTNVKRISTGLLTGWGLIPVAVAIRPDGDAHSVLIVSDMTEIVSAQEKLLESSNLLNNILQSSTKYSIIGATLDRLILFWNEGACRNYGYTSDEMIGQSLDLLFAPEVRDLPAKQQLIDTAFAQGSAEGEFERLRKDGSRFTAQTVMTRRDDAAGNPVGFLIISCDISDKLRAEEELHSMAQYARNLLEACLDPLITIDPQGIVTDVNHATALITGEIRERLIGRDFAILFSEPEKARMAFQRVFAKGFMIDKRLAVRHVARTMTEVLCNASLYHDASGKVAGVFLVARDISRVVPDDLTQASARRGKSWWPQVGIAAAALAFILVATTLPLVPRLLLQQHQDRNDFYQLTATNSRLHMLTHEVTPPPARVQAARVQASNGGLGPTYTVTHTIGAPNEDAGGIGKQQLLSRFADQIASLSSGVCAYLPQASQANGNDLIVCPVVWDASLRGLAFMMWDQSDPVPSDIGPATAALKRAASDIGAIWFESER
jgi:PAS domain S-box-containing protein